MHPPLATVSLNTINIYKNLINIGKIVSFVTLTLKNAKKNKLVTNVNFLKIVYTGYRGFH